MKRNQLFAFTTALFMIGQPLMNTPLMAKEINVQSNDQAKIRLQKAQAQYDLGSAGFFKELANEGDEDAKYAYKIITMNSSNYNEFVGASDISGYTHLGREDDATNLENMKKAVDLLPLTNQYRQKENNTEGTRLENLLVSSSLMAISQLNTNYSRENYDHAPSFSVGENLAFGYLNPFEGWYEKEKAMFKAGITDMNKIGHYKNVVNPLCQYMGTARAKTKYYGSVWGQVYDNDPSWYVKEAVSVEEYTAKFNKYYNRVATELREARKACGYTEPDEMQGQGTQPDETLDIQLDGMKRLYNPNSGEHFYTSNPAEVNKLVSVGWKYEGIGWQAPERSNTPVYRLYNSNAGDHHYTTDLTERFSLIKAGWKDEGIGWYSDDNKGIPLYRQYNPNAVSGSHNYTTSQEENNYLASIGWRKEGIAWYGLK